MVETKSMDTIDESEFLKELDLAISEIDRALAAGRIPLNERPLLAAIEYVKHFVIEVGSNADSISAVPGEFTSFAASPWFGFVYGRVEDWYSQRFGEAWKQREERTLKAIVIVYQTPFSFIVPTTVTSPADNGCIWLSFPNAVSASENPEDWLESPPNLTTMDSQLRVELGEEMRGTASRLRFLSTSLLEVKSLEETGRRLRRGILLHLRSAATTIVEPREPDLPRSFHELQMVSELALKALQQHEGASFVETHDLFRLFDGTSLARDVPEKRALLRKIPGWHEMIDLRYGLPTNRGLFDWYKCYQAVLELAAECVKPMRGGLRIGGGAFKLAMPPWMRRETGPRRTT